MRDIDKIIIHCSATRAGADVSVKTIRKWHLKRNFKDIGYHWVILLNGTIEPGRPELIAGSHTKGHNANSIGVCYVGGVDQEMKPKDTRTPAQKIAIQKLLFELTDRYKGATIHGHNEFSSKACPSFNVQTEL